MRIIRLIILAVTIFPQVAFGELFSADLVDPSGALVVDGVTSDSNTGLEWVDLTITQGATTVDALLGGAGGGVPGRPYGRTRSAG